jgi:7-carboxy-7-deazaguanine synthase
MQLPVNEVFPTIQGEAHWTGTPATFVRLQSCPVGCVFCDTRHTWEMDPKNVITVAEMLVKDKDAPTYANMDVNQLLTVIANYKSRHVVLTGGEPAMYNLVDLTREIIKSDKTVQIETSGTFEIKVNHETWVTLSPKIDMPGGYKVLAGSVGMADEIKMVIGKMADVEKLKGLLELRNDDHAEVWLQPVSQSPKATALCIEVARANGWRVSIQTHRFLGIR